MVRKVGPQIKKSILTATGGKPAKVRWSSQLVNERIKLRKNESKSLAPSAVENDDSPLFYAGKTYCGSWRKAVTDAGFDYDKELEQAPKGAARFLTLSPEQRAIVSVIRQRDKMHQGIDLPSVLRTDPKFARKALDAFDKKWRLVMEASGIKYENMGLLARWPRKLIIMEGQNLKSDGVQLHITSLFKQNYEFVFAVYHYFDTWASFVSATDKPDPEILAEAEDLVREEPPIQIKPQDDDEA